MDHAPVSAIVPGQTLHPDALLIRLIPAAWNPAKRPASTVPGFASMVISMSVGERDAHLHQHFLVHRFIIGNLSGNIAIPPDIENADYDM